MLREFFQSTKEAIIYGNGLQSRVVYELCSMYGKKISYAMVSENSDPAKSLRGVPLYSVTSFPKELDKDCYDVIIAVNEKHNAELIELLERNGFKNRFYSNNWSLQNELIRNLYYEAYFQFHGAIMRRTNYGERYLEYTFGKGNVWKIYYPENNPLVVSNHAGQFQDIALPSIFGDCSNFTEGPYEYGGATLHEDDAVFDLGANVGQFSSVALAKKCRVWAFEPTPSTQETLKKTLFLYDKSKYTVCPMAVADTSGEVEFSVLNNFSQTFDTGQNSMKPKPKGDGYEIIHVATISLDEFVKKNNISRVDFIKADIEGAERLMLQGAQNTLSRFAPRLVLCTYHLPDDPEVMERLILEANPRYVIEHKWKKLYAHCP